MVKDFLEVSGVTRSPTKEHPKRKIEGNSHTFMNNYYKQSKKVCSVRRYVRVPLRLRGCLKNNVLAKDFINLNLETIFFKGQRCANWSWALWQIWANLGKEAVFEEIERVSVLNQSQLKDYAVSTAPRDECHRLLLWLDQRGAVNWIFFGWERMFFNCFASKVTHQPRALLAAI